MRHRAGIVAALLVFQFLGKQLDGRFMHDNLLCGQQHIVIGQPRVQQRIVTTV